MGSVSVVSNSVEILQINKSAVIIAAFLVVIAVIISIVIKKARKSDAVELPENVPSEGNEEEIIAAITAAVTLLLEEEAKVENKEMPQFRVVAFKRTNNRRIGG